MLLASKWGAVVGFGDDLGAASTVPAWSEEREREQAKQNGLAFIRYEMAKCRWSTQTLSEEIGWHQADVEALMRGELARFALEQISEAMAPFGGRIAELRGPRDA